ncbi:MAG: hypothetical protein ACK44A_04930 [Roseateles sp.]
MSMADLVADLKASVHDAASSFKSADDWPRLLRTAALAMVCKRPRTLLGSLTLTAGVDAYLLPTELQASFARYKTHAWASGSIKPWCPGYPGAVPRVSVEGQAGSWQLVFDPAPTAAQIAAWGSSFRFWYFGAHVLADDAAQTTLAATDRGLLLLRAQAEAMRELAMNGVNKAVQMRDGFSGATRNSTPAALFEVLLREWEAAS